MSCCLCWCCGGVIGRRRVCNVASSCALSFVCVRLTMVLCLLLLVCSPDGLKKAYVRLTGDYDALEVANRIGII